MTVVGCVSWFTVLAWIAASAFIIAWGLTSRVDSRRKWFLSACLLLAFIAITTTVLRAGLVFIDPDERGVVISAVEETGVRSEPLQPGLNWVVPYLETTVTYPITRQPYAMTVVPREGPYVEDDLIQARTAEGDTRYVGVFVLYSIIPNRVVDVHIRYQDQYEEDLVRPVLRGTIRDTFHQYDTEVIDSENTKPIEAQIQAEAALALQEGGVLLLEFTLTEVLTEQEYSALLEQRRSEEPEEEVTTVEQESSLAGVQNALQTAACLAFPLVVILAVVLNVRRKVAADEPSEMGAKGRESDAEQGVGMEVLEASSPEEYYLLGKALLERGERAQAIEAFTETYRASEDPILKGEALKQLEGLDAVKRL